MCYLISLAGALRILGRLGRFLPYAYCALVDVYWVGGLNAGMGHVGMNINLLCESGSTRASCYCTVLINAIECISTYTISIPCGVCGALRCSSLNTHMDCTSSLLHIVDSTCIA